MSKKDVYIKKMKAQLDEWSAEIDKMQAKARKAEADLQMEYQETVDNVISLRTEAKKKLSNFKEKSGTAWAELSDSVNTAWDELEQALNQARKQFQ